MIQNHKYPEYLWIYPSVLYPLQAFCSFDQLSSQTSLHKWTLPMYLFYQLPESDSTWVTFSREEIGVINSYIRIINENSTSSGKYQDENVKKENQQEMEYKHFD